MAAPRRSTPPARPTSAARPATGPSTPPRSRRRVTIDAPVPMTPPFAVPAVTVEPGWRITFSGTASDDEGLKNVGVVGGAAEGEAATGGHRVGRGRGGRGHRRRGREGHRRGETTARDGPVAHDAPEVRLSAVSIAVADTRQVASYGTVTSHDQVARSRPRSRPARWTEGVERRGHRAVLLQVTQVTRRAPT